MELTGNVLEQFMNDNVLTTIDEDNKFNEVVEFYTEEELVVLINGHEYIRVENPFITGDPFAIITYEKQLATCMGIGIGQKLMPYQRATNMYWCSIKDALIQHLKPMYTSEIGKLKDVDGDVPFHINYVP
jgi:hypothetical protein